ncbi:hypothetical protein ILYODFUR_038021 [Ilyodon furcidens]|uniref:Uncharacterized protein n=1 Tax=Ilyodon furcidens TaxID=33524 RepID=A0ABV0VM08_9TELE
MITPPFYLVSANQQQSSDEWHGSTGSSSCSNSEDPFIYSGSPLHSCRGQRSERCECVTHYYGDDLVGGTHLDPADSVLIPAAEVFTLGHDIIISVSGEQLGHAPDQDGCASGGWGFSCFHTWDLTPANHHGA